MISEPEYEWEQRGFYVNEGPAILKKNGKIFLAYSASATDHHYCMGLLTAAEDKAIFWIPNPGSSPRSQYLSPMKKPANMDQATTVLQFQKTVNWTY